MVWTAVQPDDRRALQEEDAQREEEKELLILNAMRYDALLDEQEGGLLYMNAMAIRNGSSLRVKLKARALAPAHPTRRRAAPPRSGLWGRSDGAKNIFGVSANLLLPSIPYSYVLPLFYFSSHCPVVSTPQVVRYYTIRLTHARPSPMDAPFGAQALRYRTRHLPTMANVTVITLAHLLSLMDDKSHLITPIIASGVCL